MAAAQFYLPFPVAFTSNGLPAPGAKLYFYESGTSTPQAVFADAGLTTPRSNPVVANGAGRFPTTYFDDALSYRLVVTDRNGALLDDIDPMLSTGGGEGDTALRSDLAALSGANLVGTRASGTGAVTRTVRDKLRDFASIEDFGAKGDGTTDDTAAFTAAAALGVEIRLKPGATYLMSGGVSCITGARFVCPAMATIKLKTGSGGFNSTDLTADKNSLTRCVFLFNARDNIGIEGVRFITDGVAERVLYPIRVTGGGATFGCDFKRIRFIGLSVTNGGYLSVNSIGAGGYRVHDVEARGCGTALSTWTGTPQISVCELDNDLVGGVNSEPGIFTNIRGINHKLSGAALTAYGQQTDVLNIAGGSTPKGPTAHNIYGDGCGEVLDCFADYGTFTGVRGKDCRVVAKLVHGASFNHISLIAESWSDSAVEIAGSGNVGVGDTSYNHIVITNANNGGTVGTSESQIVLFAQNGGSTGVPKHNTVIIENAAVTASLDHLVKDNCTGTDNGNRVEIRKLVGAVGGTAYEVVNSSNVKVAGPAGFARMTMSGNQTLTTATPTVVQFNTVSTDANAETVAGSFKVRAKHPGRKRIRASVRATLNANAIVKLSILKAGAEIAFTQVPVLNGTDAYTYEVEAINEVTAGEADRVDADFTISATITGTGTLTLLNTGSATFFEVVDLS